MRVVVDALAALEGSHSIIAQNLLHGWGRLGTDDEVYLVIGPETPIEAPDWVRVRRLPLNSPGALPPTARRVAAQTVQLRRICREVDAQALLATLPASAMADLGVARSTIVYDLRHELRPEQFSRAQRLLRRVSYGYGYHAAESLVCISERTRNDLLRLHPRLMRKPVPVGWLGADHVDTWERPARGAERPYALAFGHFGNKNVEQVVRAWAELARRIPADRLPELRISGMSAVNKTATCELAGSLGIGEHVAPLPWVTREEFKAVFAGASMIVFPSDFEGFGMPAAEAMRLRIPLVISGDPALVEVAGGYAAVAATVDPPTLATAVERAMDIGAEQLDAAHEFASRYTWEGMARVVREALESARQRRAARR